MSPQTMTQYDEARRTRSRRSILAENDLCNNLKKIDTAAAISEQRIRQGDEYVRRVHRAVMLEGNEQMRPQLEDAVKNLAAQREILKSCQAQRASTEAEIEKLSPSPAEAALREQRQQQTAELVKRRFEKDREAEQLLGNLHEILQDRGQLTAEIIESIAPLELTISGDGLDTARFEKLLASLPSGLLTESERWSGWFLGHPKDAKPYVVCVQDLLVREILTDNGLYHFGEHVSLTEEEARDLLCDDYFGAMPGAPWRCEPPRVMTAEAYESVLRTAREKGLSAQEVVFWRNVERDVENRTWFKNNGARKTSKRRPPALDDNVTLQTVAKVRVRYKGEVMEVPEKEAWELLDAGAVSP